MTVVSNIGNVVGTTLYILTRIISFTLKAFLIE